MEKNDKIIKENLDDIAEENIISENTNVKRKDRSKKEENTILGLFKTIIFSILFALFIRVFVISIANVDGVSMESTLINNDKLLMEKVSNVFGLLGRGDIVAFIPPNDSGDIYVKRIIGKEGDTIKLQDEAVYLNGELLKEDYLDEGVITIGESFLHEGESVTVGKDEYFVMGDNRTRSSDSREFGLIKKDSIIGHPILRLYPFDSISLLN